MSQAKVDAYKKEKANRKKNLKAQKTKSLVYKILGGVAVVAISGWIIWSVVDANKPVSYSKAEIESMRTNILKYADYLGIDKSKYGIEETTTKAPEKQTTTSADKETTTGGEDATTVEGEETTTVNSEDETTTKAE